MKAPAAARRAEPAGIKVSLAGAREGCGPDFRCDIPRPLADPRGSAVVLGCSSGSGVAVAPIVPAADTLFGPRGAQLAGREGPLYVCDTGHNRLLVWNRAPRADHAPADFVLGQADFHGEARNAGGEPGPDTFNVPVGIAVDGDVLAIADAWNHRVLIWHGLPRGPRPADVVIGQTDFRSSQPNRGLPAPRADTLNWCYGVQMHAGRLFVADTGNRRVLAWDAIPKANGAPADLVLGQRDFVMRDQQAAEAAGATGMRWPHAIAASDGLMFVADAGSSRIMAWKRAPARNGAPCDFVVGQKDMTGADHNCGGYFPSAATLNMPYGLAVQQKRLIIADTANSRLLGFDIDRLDSRARATWLSGQADFESRGENQWDRPGRGNLCWPYSVTSCGTTLVVADSGNNRLLIWESA
jgi:hypothetical protein